MKKIYFLVFAFCFFNGLNAQIVNIPDVNFKTILLTYPYCAKDINGDYLKIDTNGDGEIQENEALAVVDLYVDPESNDDKKITSLEGLIKFTNLKFFNCKRNKLTAINLNGLTKLERLNCYSNNLTSLDLSGLTNLQELECNYNQITSLNINFLTNLQSLDCGGNQLTSLDLKGLTNLQSLDCSANKFNVLDINGLTNPNLQSLDCSANPIYSLKLNGLNKLKYLSCLGNKFASLDLSSLTSLKSLYCASLDLTTLFIKNGSAEDLREQSLVPSPKLKYICADESDFKILEFILNTQDPKVDAIYGSTRYQVGSYCSFTPGGTFYTIQGSQKLDSNADGCDTQDIVVPNLNFKITDGIKTGNMISNSSGNYSIYVQAGTHTITPVFENLTYFNVSPANAIVTFPTQASPVIKDFCITPNGTNPDLEVSLLPIDRARPGFDVSYKLVYKNKGNTTQSGTVNLTFDDSILDLVSSNTTISSQTVNMLSWNFTNLKSFETKEILVVLNLNGPTETPVVNNGDVLNSTTTIVSLATDKTPNDNTFTLNQTVVGSFDPNDKTCLEGDVITPGLIGEYVHYLIRFENKGTYSAQNIVVKDMIDLSKFDISTLVPTSSSHQFATKISENNKVEFIFENINLPFDDVNNDGYIAFKIKTKPTLKVGDSFDNEANIYFDYNFPVLTNKATSTFKTTLNTSDFEFSNYFKVYPIPAHEVLNISAIQNIEIQSIAVYDILGQLVIALPNVKDASKIDVSNLRTGNYFLKIKSDKGSSSMKFIKN